MFTSIEQFLKNVRGSRLDYGDRWLVWRDEKWLVNSRTYGQKKTRTLIATENLAQALEFLVNDASE